MGGPKKENRDAELAATRGQLELGNKLAAQSDERLKTQQAYEAPLVGWLKGIIGGDTRSKLATAAVPIGEITRGTAAARENILDSVPAGAGRDFALSSLRRDEAGQKATFLNNAFLNAFPALAKVGQGNANIGLQQLGGGLRSTEAGVSNIGNINNRDAQSKASTLGLIGNLAGAAGGAAFGRIGGGGSKPPSSTNWSGVGF